MLCTHCLVVQELPQNKLTVPAMMFKPLSISLCQVATFKRVLGVLKMVITVIHESLRQYDWYYAQVSLTCEEGHIITPLLVSTDCCYWRTVWEKRFTLVRSQCTHILLNWAGKARVASFSFRRTVLCHPSYSKMEDTSVKIAPLLRCFPFLNSASYISLLRATPHHLLSQNFLWVFGRWLKFKGSRDTSGYVYACETIQCSLYFSFISWDQEEEKGQSELRKVCKEITSCPSW